MKSEKEIREEIEVTLRTRENHRNAYKKGTIGVERLKNHLIDSDAIVATLKWVLGENDRYD